MEGSCSHCLPPLSAHLLLAPLRNLPLPPYYNHCPYWVLAPKLGTDPDSPGVGGRAQNLTDEEAEVCERKERLQFRFRGGV